MSSGPDRDDQVMTLIAGALALPPNDRNAYLHGACEGDEELLADVEETLEWEERMGSFLRKPWMSLQNLERPFAPGQLVNDRFEIIREIGQGGMGIVYEAFDRKRGQRIAVKSAKVGFRRLLTPELEAALKVRHPNVCLVNEIHTAATDYGDVDFLTMELLEGFTLHARLSSDGRLPPAEALEIVRQLCAGLAEAHRIGIVHKDLKPANVILSKLPDGTPRVVITDFGLAGEPAVGAGDLAGTPQYMAPELWQGAPASKASDLYALGVIVYEMVTGGKPFAGEPTQARLTGRPPPPSRSASVDRRWDTAILRCLDPSPAARPHDAAEAFASLTAPPPRKAPLLAAGIVLLLLAGLAAWPALRHRLAPANVRLAILPVTGTRDAGAVGNGALLEVANRLGQRTGPPTLVVIPPSRSLENNVVTPEQARRILDATHALQITVRRDEGGNLLAHGAVIDLATQTRLHEISGLYPPANAGDLAVALTGAVSHALRLRDVAEEPISTAAAVPYLEGLFYLRRDQHGFDQAIPLFRKAAALDPHSPLPPAGLVEALVLKYQSGKDLRLLDEAERTLQAARALNPDSVAVLLAGARLGLSRGGHYDDALENYRRVAELQPRNVEAWLRIAETEDRRGRRKEAIESYRKAIALDPDYYETYQEFGVFYYWRGEYAHAAEQFRKAIAHAPGFYNAHTNLGATLSDMGDDRAAEEALRNSLQIRENAGALNSLAAIRAYQKRDAEALVLYKRSLALNPHSYICLMNLGDSSRRQGLREDAHVYYQQGSEIASADLQNDPKNGRTRAFFGYFAARLGDPRRGEQEIEQALQFAPSDEAVIRRAVLTYELLGQRDRALRIAGTATLDLLRKLDRHPDLAGFRQDPRFRQLRVKSENGG